MVDDLAPTEEGGHPQPDARPEQAVAGVRAARKLTAGQVVRESTRFAVGSALLVGTGFRRMLERFGTPEDELLSATETSSEIEETETRAPQSAAGAVLVGFLLETQRALLEQATEVRSALSTVGDRLAPVGDRVGEVPVIGPAGALLAEALARSYETGRREQLASRTYAARAIEGASQLGLDWIVENLDIDPIMDRIDINSIVQNLELTNVIIDSTGGMAETAMDAVRSQAVGADSLVERIVGTVLRRKANEDLVVTGRDERATSHHEIGPTE